MKHFRFPGTLGIALAALMLFQTSCENDDLKNPKQPEPKLDQNDRVLNEIMALGYTAERIQNYPDRYVVDGDMAFYKNGDYKTNTPLPNGKSQQAHHNVFVAYNNQKTITVRVDGSIPTSGVDNWRNEVILACVSWNNANSRIKLTYTTAASANITIRSDAGALPDYVIAEGSLPSGGNAGATIIVNLDFNSNMTVSQAQKEYNMVHELGHNIGFRHTNWRLNETAYPAYGIPGTPNTGTNPDSGSVMNGGTALNSWTQLSNYDIIGIRRMYPEDNDSNRAYDPAYYLFAHNDLQAIYGSNPNGLRTHWLNARISEGRVGSPVFDNDYYIARYADVAGMTRLQATTHFVTDGSNEGRVGSPAFDVSYYLQNNSDLLAAYGAQGYQKAISHYITTGIDEGRKASAEFDPKKYLEKNADLAAAYGSTNYRQALYHWVAFGRAEGRVAL